MAAASSPLAYRTINENATTFEETCSVESCSDFDDFLVSIGEAMNPSRRSNMEDRFIVHEPGKWGVPDSNMSYIGVYDGHGGRDMVDFLEHGLSYHVVHELNDSSDDSDIQTKLERAFLLTDIHARQMGIMTSGATAAICLVTRDPEKRNKVTITTANVGDARIVLGLAGESARRLTRDHNSSDPHEVSRIEQSGGFLLKNRVLGILAITRSFGNQFLKKFVISTPYVQQITVNIEPCQSLPSCNDKSILPFFIPSFLIIACDGLWDVMTDQQAVELVRYYEGDKSLVSKFLVVQALSRGSCDNLTVVILWL